MGFESGFYMEENFSGNVKTSMYRKSKKTDEHKTTIGWKEC